VAKKESETALAQCKHYCQWGGYNLSTLEKSILRCMLLFQHFVEKKLELFLHEEQEKRKLKSMKAKEFDKIFDDNKEDIIEYLDLSTMERPNLEPKRINIDFLKLCY